MVTLKNELEQNIIEARDLKDGQIAIIVEDYSNYKGTIVQRYGHSMVAIGQNLSCGWDNITVNTLKVKVLDEGEILVVTNNK